MTRANVKGTGGSAVSRLGGTDVLRASGCAAVSGAQCFWHNARSDGPRISGQIPSMAFIEPADDIAMIGAIDAGAMAHA